MPIGYAYFRCHMIFDVKIEDFRRKAQLFAGGHMAETPATTNYANVVYREAVCLALVISEFNDPEVKCGDVLNAYITVPIGEKVWTNLGPEFGDDAGKWMLIFRALYGLKSAGAAFCVHLGHCMQGLGYEPCIADPDLWMNTEVIPDDKYEYYSYILCYVDDIMVIHHDQASLYRDI